MSFLSLRRLSLLTEHVSNIIILAPSPSLAYHLKSLLKQHFKVAGDYIISADTPKALRGAKLDSYVSPLLGDKWLIHVNVEKFTDKELQAALTNNTRNGITVYWTDKYKVFKTLENSDVVKAQGAYCQLFSFSRLEQADILQLHRDMLPEDLALKPSLLDFLCANYRYDPQAVCDLFAMMRSGDLVKSKNDILDLVGIGGISIESLVVRILAGLPSSFEAKAERAFRETLRTKTKAFRRKYRTADLTLLHEHLTERRGYYLAAVMDHALDLAFERYDYPTDETYLALIFDVKTAADRLKKKKVLFKNVVKLLNDLSSSYNYQSIRRFMLHSLDGFIDMKQLQIMGIYGRVNKDIPDTYDQARLTRLKRFERVILNHVSLSQLLNLKLALLKYRDFNTQVSLLQSISEYFNVRGSVKGADPIPSEVSLRAHKVI